jgi:hypothetical protein
MQWLTDEKELIILQPSPITDYEHPVVAQPQSPKQPEVDDPLDLLVYQVPDTVDSSQKTAAEEMAAVLHQPTITRQTCPLDWRRVNAGN